MPVPEEKIVVCLPIYNDWESAMLLLKQLDVVAQQWGPEVEVVFVDDGSLDQAPQRVDHTLSHLAKVHILQLRRNVGHQRAIAIGLSWIHRTAEAAYVIVMDADGEDAPEDVLTLLNKCRESRSREIIFAQRRKRSENATFRLGYLAFKWMHRLLTGRSVNIGNFSVIPAQSLDRIVGVSEIWNHYAAGVVHSKLPMNTVPIDRAQRLRGVSKMNFVSLITHGMSAISVYGDVVGVRLLCVVSGLTALVVAALLTVLVLRLFTELAIPGWATSAVGLLAVLLLNLMMLSLVFVFTILQSRTMAGFLPVRDWENYVAVHITIFGQ